MVLQDSRAKLGRAQEHFDTLQREIDAFLETKPYRIVIDRPLDHWYVFRIDTASDIPSERWALLIGDCVHNLRAALDYIAWRLAGSDPDDTHTQFPIFLTEGSWDRSASKCIRSMGSAAQALLKAGQPFNRPNPRNSALGGIHVLDNADKHKLLTVVAAMPRQLSIQFGSTASADDRPNTSVTVASKPALRSNAVLAVLHDPNPALAMDMESELTPDIAFGESLYPGPMHTVVVGSLSAAIVEVQTIIEFFESRPEVFPRLPLI
jgi:hypothetical protein